MSYQYILSSRDGAGMGSRDGAVVIALAFHQCVPGSILDSRIRRHMWTEFVGSLLCSERFFSGYSGFPLSSKTNIYLAFFLVIFKNFLVIFKNLVFNIVIVKSYSLMFQGKFSISYYALLIIVNSFID